MGIKQVQHELVPRTTVLYVLDSQCEATSHSDQVVSHIFSVYLQEFYASKSIFSYVYSKQLMDCAISLVINREFINPGWTSAWLNILIKVIDPCVPG